MTPFDWIVWCLMLAGLASPVVVVAVMIIRAMRRARG